VDAGQRPGTTSEEAAEIKRLRARGGQVQFRLGDLDA
jgi:hypothetical protein